MIPLESKRGCILASLPGILDVCIFGVCYCITGVYLTLQPKPDVGWGDGHWPNAGGQQQQQQQQRPQKSSSLGGAWDINDWMSASRRVRKAIISSLFNSVLLDIIREVSVSLEQDSIA